MTHKLLKFPENNNKALPLFLEPLISINLLLFFLVSKLWFTFPSPWDSSLVLLLFRYTCFSIIYFFMCFPFPSLIKQPLHFHMQTELYLRGLCIHSTSFSLCVSHLSVSDTNSQGKQTNISHPPTPDLLPISAQKDFFQSLWIYFPSI